MPTLDQAGRTRVEAAIAEAEARSAGELVVLTTPASDAYHDVRLLYAAALAVCAAALTHLAQPAWPLDGLIWLQLGVAALAWRVLALPGLLRLLLPHSRVEHSVQVRARVAFLDHELFATRDRSGVLILISELEHRVVILGDRGIHEHLPEGAWDKHVARIVAGFRAGDPASALCVVIKELGDVLAASFPRRDDDVNELPDRVQSDN